jgi:hypothetical protein
MGMNRLALAVIYAALPGMAAAGLLGPSNYDECVLEPWSL